MNQTLSVLKRSWLMALLVFVPISIALHLLHANPLVVFAATCFAIMPLAAIMGRATEELAQHLGDAAGGLLNATFGNATEFLIALMAVLAGEEAIVKASIAGSIIGNILLVLGLSMFLGGLKHEVQRFNTTGFTVGSSMLKITAIALIFPSLISFIQHHSFTYVADDTVQMSLWISGLLILVYACSILFTLKTHRHIFMGEAQHHAGAAETSWSNRKSLLLLLVSTTFVALESHLLVHHIELASASVGLRQSYVAIFIVAIFGNAAEHSTGVLMAMKNKMDLALQIAIGSSVQVALLILPLIILIAWIAGKPITILFPPEQVVAIYLSGEIVRSVATDSESNWIEGMLLLVVYAIFGVCLYFVTH